MRLNYINRSEKPYITFPAHTHSYWEMMLTLEGEGVQHADGRIFSFQPGSVLLVPPHALHSTESKAGFREFTLAFYDFVPIGSGEVLQFHDDEQNHIWLLCEWILENVRTTGAASLTDALVLALYQLLVARANISADLPPELLELRRQMTEHLNDSDFDLASAMDASGYSRGYLRRIFKEKTGMAPLCWLNHRRVEAAMQYFRQYPEVLTVKEVAVMTGFSDPYYFSRLFRKFTGLSPTDYRRQFLDNPGYEAPVPEEYIVQPGSDISPQGSSC